MIETFDGRMVHLPNSKVLDEPLANHTLVGARRAEVEVRVEHTGPVADLLDALRGGRGGRRRRRPRSGRHGDPRRHGPGAGARHRPVLAPSDDVLRGDHGRGRRPRLGARRPVARCGRHLAGPTAGARAAADGLSRARRRGRRGVIGARPRPDAAADSSRDHRTRAVRLLHGAGGTALRPAPVGQPRPGAVRRLRPPLRRPGPRGLGCGDGDPLLALRAEGLDVEGLDSSADMLDRCRVRADAAGLDVVLHHAADGSDGPRPHLPGDLPGRPDVQPPRRRRPGRGRTRADPRPPGARCESAGAPVRPRGRPEPRCDEGVGDDAGDPDRGRAGRRGPRS